MNKKSFEEHIKNEHQSSPFTTYLEECVYGGNDGIVTTFAVVAGFSGANIGEHTLNLSIVAVLLFGLANLIADGAAMGLGNYLSIKSAKKLFKNEYEKEILEIKQSTEYEITETEYIYQTQGFSEQDSKALTSIVKKNPDYWAKFMVHHECGLDYNDQRDALKNGTATFISFVCFGFIPLIPYFFDNSIKTAFIYSTGFTLLALSLLGILRSVVAKDNLLISIIETIFIGGLAASLAYVVGSLFKV